MTTYADRFIPPAPPMQEKKLIVMYLAKHRECGHVVAVQVDILHRRNDVAETVSEWIRDGLIVERGESQAFQFCDCEEKGEVRES